MLDLMQGTQTPFSFCGPSPGRRGAPAVGHLGRGRLGVREGAGGRTQKGEAVLPPASGDTGCRVPGHTCPLIGCSQHFSAQLGGCGECGALQEK